MFLGNISYTANASLFPFQIAPHLQEHTFVDEQQSECVGCTHGNFCVIFSAKAKLFLLLLFLDLWCPQVLPIRMEEHYVE